MVFESQVEDYALRIAKSTAGITQQASLRLEAIENRTLLQAQNRVTEQEQELAGRLANLKIKAKGKVDLLKQRIMALEDRHKDLNPGNILNRGYTFTTSNRNSIFAKQVKKHDQLVTYSRDQIIESKVTKTSKNDKI
jgi:exonuclease VII large subunit